MVQIKILVIDFLKLPENVLNHYPKGAHKALEECQGCIYYIKQVYLGKSCLYVLMALL